MEDFNSSDTEWQYHLQDSSDDTLYDIKMIKEVNLFINIEFGKPHPRRSQLIDINTHPYKDNLRTEDEAELMERFFVYFDFQKNYTYISNQQKLNVFKNIFKEKYYN